MHVHFIILKKDKQKKHRGFGDFFPLISTSLHNHVPVITMEEFIKREGNGIDGLFPIVSSSKEDNAQSDKTPLFSESFCIQRQTGK